MKYSQQSSAFNEGTEYRKPNLFVRRWDETLMPLPDGQSSGIEDLVNIRLDDIVYLMYRAGPATFAPPHRFLLALQKQFEEDRRALQAGRAPAKEHFNRVLKKQCAVHRIQLPGREEEFTDWIYDKPDWCPACTCTMRFTEP
jgi:hypothetical protein